MSFLSFLFPSYFPSVSPPFLPFPFSFQFLPPFFPPTFHLSFILLPLPLFSPPSFHFAPFHSLSFVSSSLPLSFHPLPLHGELTSLHSVKYSRPMMHCCRTGGLNRWLCSLASLIIISRLCWAPDEQKVNIDLWISVSLGAANERMNHRDE